MLASGLLQNLTSHSPALRKPLFLYHLNIHDTAQLTSNTDNKVHLLVTVFALLLLSNSILNVFVSWPHICPIITHCTLTVSQLRKDPGPKLLTSKHLYPDCKNTRHSAPRQILAGWQIRAVRKHKQHFIAGPLACINEPPALFEILSDWK